MSATTTYRVRTATRDRLNRLARQDGISGAELLDRLVAREEEERLLAGMNDDFARLRDRPEKWGDFQAETAMWDVTSSDEGPTG